MTVRTEVVSWYSQLMTSGRMQMLPGGHYWNADHCKIPRNTSIETAVYHHTELMLDAYRHVKPMELSVKKLRQAVRISGQTVC